MLAFDILLEDLGFPEWNEATGRRSVADLYRVNQRCGIYVLGFATGEQYIGQAVDVVRRFTQHCKTHNDIVRITFQQIKQNELNEVERRCIHKAEASGMPLRNLAHMSVVQEERDLDLVVSPEEQESWYRGTYDLRNIEEHIQDDSLRYRHKRKFSRFLALKHANDTLYLLGMYIQNTILSPRATELTFWSVSCLPYGIQPEKTLYYRLNINMQEVLSIWGSKEGIEASFHIAYSPFRDKLGADWEYKLILEGWDLTHHRYKPGGEDQFNIFACGNEQIQSIMGRKPGKTAISLLNWRLMRKGATYYSRSHCLDLVDAAIASFETGG